MHYILSHSPAWWQKLGKIPLRGPGGDLYNYRTAVCIKISACLKEQFGFCVVEFSLQVQTFCLYNANMSVDWHIEVNIWPVPNFYELEGGNPRVTGHALNTFRIETDLELKMMTGFKLDNWQVTRASTSQRWAVLWGGRVALSYQSSHLNMTTTEVTYLGQ